MRLITIFVEMMVPLNLNRQFRLDGATSRSGFIQLIVARNRVFSFGLLSVNVIVTDVKASSFAWIFFQVNMPFMLMMLVTWLV